MRYEIKIIVYHKSPDNKICIKKTRRLCLDHLCQNKTEFFDIEIQIEDKKITFTENDLDILLELLNKSKMDECKLPEGIEDHLWNQRKRYDP